MKAVLVIDMPQNCGKCPISEYILFENGKARADAGGNCPIANNYIDKWNERPSWCPLKPMPEKLPEVSYDSGWWGWNKILDRIIEEQIKVKDFTKGWNACLDEILGETE